MLWVPRGREDGALSWERVGTVARDEVERRGGLCAARAASIRARQGGRGMLGGLLARLGGRGRDRVWTLPGGGTAEQVGGRRADLLLVWPESPPVPGDDLEARVRALWPEAGTVERLGSGLVLLGSVEAQARPGVTAAGPAADPGSPIEQAERLLEAARRDGHARREAEATTDLGIVALRAGDHRRAAELLAAALGPARDSGDRAWEAEVVGNLGMARLNLGDATSGLPMITEALAIARESGQPFLHKSALDRYGMALARLDDPPGAIPYLEQALALAREVDDRQHAADLLWTLAILHDGQGRRDAAVASAAESVELLRRIGNPKADWFEDHLRRFREGDAPAWPAAANPGSSPTPAPAGPGLLRMAFTATEAMAKFLGSGLKTSPPEVVAARLRTCDACDRHTGVRCRVCGCITSIKARLPHERCPIGKW